MTAIVCLIALLQVQLCRAYTYTPFLSRTPLSPLLPVTTRNIARFSASATATTATATATPTAAQTLSTPNTAPTTPQLDGLGDGLGNGLGDRAGTGAWLPVTVISQMDADPTEMQIAGDTYVVWRDPLKGEQGWSVMRDECPHRRAPLSQGRVDPVTGNIECAYHGWQFDTAGTCTAIPQKNAALKCETVESAQALPTHITGDILWAYFPLPGIGVPGSSLGSQSYDTLPEVLFPSLLDGTANFKSRELPYNWDFLVENFMDPAHIPFAHHKLQGTREDAMPIPMQLLTSKDNNTHCEIGFQDKTRGKTRSGVVSFVAPCHYHFRVKKEGESDFKIGLLGFVVPTVPGQCRLIFSVALPPKLRKVIPTWLDHAISNRFLDSDLWLHEAERRVRGPGNAFYSTSRGGRGETVGEGVAASVSAAAAAVASLAAAVSALAAGTPESSVAKVALAKSALASVEGLVEEVAVGEQVGEQGYMGGSSEAKNMGYQLPTESDLACVAWRQWWARHMSLSPLFGPVPNPPTLSRELQYDRYASHTKHCTHCRQLLTNAKKLKRYAPVAGALVSLQPLYHLGTLLSQLFVRLPSALYLLSAPLRLLLPALPILPPLPLPAYVALPLSAASVWLWRLGGLLTYVLLDRAADGMARSAEGPRRGEKVSAALL